jgi:TPR repeat protein
VLKDYKQAVYWYQKAADQGYAKAQSNLGIAYAFGKGVLKDDKKAVYLFDTNTRLAYNLLTRLCQ